MDGIFRNNPDYSGKINESVIIDLKDLPKPVYETCRFMEYSELFRNILYLKFMVMRHYYLLNVKISQGLLINLSISGII